MLSMMSARDCAPHTVGTSPTAMYGSIIGIGGRASRGPRRGVKRPQAGVSDRNRKAESETCSALGAVW